MQTLLTRRLALLLVKQIVLVAFVWVYDKRLSAVFKEVFLQKLLKTVDLPICLLFQTFQTQRNANRKLAD